MPIASLDILLGKEYNYIYEKGVIARANECNVTTDGKTIVSTVFYTYDKDGKLVKKRVISQSGEVRTYNFENPEDGNALLRFEANGKTVTSQSKTDSFGRKVFEELQLGSGFVSRQFSYYSGDITEEHRTGEKLKSSPTTQLVSQITFSGGRTVSYEYDAEERITKVTDSVDGITEYTYDALGQLLTEKKNGTVVNAMTYDNYGNIVSKNGISYTYGNSSWKDLLTKVGNQTISYDNQGNPTSYLGHTLTWEKGRQLKSFDSNTYTYNANGIRTSKTINGVKHSYVLDGTKILKETWGNNVLIPLYDNEDSICGIEYNGSAYWFYKNLQGDIISIANADGDVIAKYTYDAWGVCTVEEDTSEVGIATVNPYRYRSYYYDTEIGMYYLQSRYYDPDIGRWLNSDIPSIIGLLFISKNVLDPNLFLFCSNQPIDDVDITGCISANKIASMFSISAIFSMFMLTLCVSYSKGLVAVGAYATKIVTPIAVKSFWWKPWLAAAIILAAVAIIVAAVAIQYASRKGEIDNARKKIPNRLMKNGKVDLSKFNNPKGPKGPRGNRGILGPLGWYILKDFDKHRGAMWKLFNKAGERIASLLSDGTITGK